MEIKGRVLTVRLRTWILTALLIVGIIFYFLVNISFGREINFVDLFFMATIQLVAHFTYFNDGELYGENNPVFANNRNNYNEKANEINENSRFFELREFCEFDYEQKRKDYIAQECAFIGITTSELDTLRTLSKKDIKKLEKYEFKTDKGSKLIIFSREKRKRLVRLFFAELPIEKNQPETIMSAVKVDKFKAIEDKSIKSRQAYHMAILLKATIFALIFAYIVIKINEGFNLCNLVKIILYLVTLITTAITSFSNGEHNTRVFKNEFFIQLINFLDKFNEWRQNKSKKQLTSINE